MTSARNKTTEEGQTEANVRNGQTDPSALAHHSSNHTYPEYEGSTFINHPHNYINHIPTQNATIITLDT